ncbi:MAG: hypothetical protein N0E59_20985 [Candidatus Thiodiazotropha taylori]|nr:hypothetical protein [Candidatus Thiodiazotropha taylori]MCW4259735.1 hypothetical protein [Candidatus Thiodiazotropha endolucinida]MCG8032159.1 hypothetical protein [Candidatus Thiodiazotropha taylori]MCG8113234.1 hypothetical protein [Candidatus Thiodiazotropha taylori]MCW4285595.1 hypothetical protein [Candidatus Thiodiazotropha taylori]
MPDYKDYLSSIYFNPASPAAFSSLDKLYRFVRKDGKYVLGKHKIRKWLLSQESYAVHREDRSRFKRRRVIAPYKDYQFDADTADMSFYVDQNDGYKYFVLLIDIFSRYVWTVALKSKTAQEMIKALKSVFSQGRVCYQLRSDKGKEFLNAPVSAYLKRMGIKHFETQNQPKSNYAERAIRTIKARLHRYMTHKQTHKWVNVLGEITDSYNHTYHRSIKQSPSSVREKDEVYQWKLQYDSLPKKPKAPYARYRFKVGDEVRVSFLRRAFQKEHDERWSREIFTIVARSMKNAIPQYDLQDYSGTAVKGKFYQNQLLKAYPSDKFLIDSVLKRRKRSGREEVLVKWKGWDKRYNSWIKSSQLSDYTPK